MNNPKHCIKLKFISGIIGFFLAIGIIMIISGSYLLYKLELQHSIDIDRGRSTGEVDIGGYASMIAIGSLLTLITMIFVILYIIKFYKECPKYFLIGIL